MLSAAAPSASCASEKNCFSALPSPRAARRVTAAYLSPAATRELLDLRFASRIFFAGWQILLGEIKANAIELHPAGLARGERNFAPIGVVFRLEGKRLAGFHCCNHGGVRVFLGSHVDKASGIIDNPGSLRLCQRREGEQAGEEYETDGFHLISVWVFNNVYKYLLNCHR